MILLDRLMPDFDVAVSKRIRIAADPHAVYALVLQLDFTDIAKRSILLLVVTLLREFPQRLRQLPNRFYCWLRNRAWPSVKTTGYRLVDLGTQGHWVRLAEEPDHEFVFGLVGKFWQLH